MTINGVIDKSTGDLIRWGISVDFLNDGSFDAANEEIRSDVPYPGKVKNGFVLEKKHNWTGTEWVEIDQ